MAAVFSLIRDYITQHKVLTSVISVAGLGTVILLVKKSRQLSYSRKCGVDYPRNTVVVQAGMSSGRHVPTVGHFCLKLMTYLRAAGIPYEVQSLSVPGPKAKVPWIEYNGTVLGDSQMIINFLNRQFDRNLNKSLSKEQRALAWAIQKWLEEFTYWMSVHTRWNLYPREFFNEDLCPELQKPMMRAFLSKYVKKMCYMVGIGRHTKEEISEMIQNDLRQFSALLGTREYVMGDTISEVDCAAFGVLGQIYYQSPASCPGVQLLKRAAEMQNVRDYMERIRSQYWPDWDQLKLK